MIKLSLATWVCFIWASATVIGKNQVQFELNSSDQPFRDKGALKLFYSLEDVKSVFKMPQNANFSACKTILDVFERICCPQEKKIFNSISKQYKYPFIVFEGNHRLSAAIMSKRFARTISAAHFSMSPPCLIPYRKLFNNDILLRRGFFGLAVYALGYQVAKALQHQPVVVTSYWNHQATYAITKILNDSDIPEPSSPVYSIWPQDLIRPDILFYTNFPDNMYSKPGTTRQPSSWKPRLLQFYRRLKVPLTFEISTRRGWVQALKETQVHVIKHLGSSKLFNFTHVNFRTSGITAK